MDSSETPQALYDAAGEFAGYMVGPTMAQRVSDAPKKAPPTRYTDKHIQLFAPGMRRAIRDTGLSGTDWRVFFTIAFRAPHTDSQWAHDADRIARDLKIAPSNVHRSVKKLLNGGYLVRPKRGWLAFHPMFAWKSGAASRERAKQAYLDSLDHEETE